MEHNIRKPRYPHTCQYCQYLGRFKRWDLYFHCPDADDSAYGSMVTARYGANPDHFISGYTESTEEPLVHALNRARKAALL